MTARFTGRVAAITGAAAGFGLAVATRLAGEGAHVVLVDWAADALHEAAKSLEGALPVVADVSQEADVDRYVAATVGAHGRIDKFFNNAGIEGRMAPMVYQRTAAQVPLGRYGTATEATHLIDGALNA